MKLGWRLGLRSLSAQMILTSVALVLLTAMAAGVPALWLIRGQLDHQAWAQVDQGSLAASSLYAARQNELAGLATLTAQRPTLRELLLADDQAALQVYLQTLLEGSGLDLVLICRLDARESELRPLAQAGQSAPTGLCAESGSLPAAAPSRPGYYVVAPESPAGARAWLFAAHAVPQDGGSPLGIVVVSLVLDDEFAGEMRDQTGLEHTLLTGGQPIATSLAGWALGTPADPADGDRETFDLAGRPFYGQRLALAGSGLEAQLALDVSGITTTQRTLIWTLGGSIAVVALVASMLGVLIARRISRPLAHLSLAADAMRAGDLVAPLAVESRVREVALLAQALEGARADLRDTLDELRQEKAWVDHLLESIVEGILTLDRQGRITFFSRGAERITGWSRDQVLGKNCDQIFTPVDTTEPFSQQIPAPGRRHKIPVETRDGRQAILAVTGARLLPPAETRTRLGEGREARVALVFRDISEEEAVHRLLGHFLANVAHEFRTPLSALAASVELLLDQAPDLSPAELEELLASVHLGVIGLQALIDNLLESASIEAGHFRVQARPVRLDEIIGEALATMQPLLEKHGQQLAVELPAAIPIVRADPRRTVQVLVNLLSNASKYGPDDAEIEVDVRVNDPWARISVSDSGAGVPPEQRVDLFRRFGPSRPQTSQTSGVSQAPEVYPAQRGAGAGLGLHVVRAIVEAHGGQVGIVDRPRGGSTFWFTLPLGSSAGGPSPHAHRRESAGAQQGSP